MALDPITGAEQLIDDALNRFIPDPAQKAAASAQVLQIVENAKTALTQSQASVITSEASSTHWMTSAWRPCLMFTFIAILIFNYILSPIVHAFGGTYMALPIPPDMWSLLRLGVGGYIGGRSIEKVVTMATTPHPVTGTTPTQSMNNAISNLFKGQ